MWNYYDARRRPEPASSTNCFHWLDWLETDSELEVAIERTDCWSGATQRAAMEGMGGGIPCLKSPLIEE